MNGRATVERCWGEMNTPTRSRRGDQEGKDQSDPAWERQPGGRQGRSRQNRLGGRCFGTRTKSDTGREAGTRSVMLRSRGERRDGRTGRLGGGVHNRFS